MPLVFSESLQSTFYTFAERIWSSNAKISLWKLRRFRRTFQLQSSFVLMDFSRTNSQCMSKKCQASSLRFCIKFVAVTVIASTWYSIQHSCNLVRYSYLYAPFQGLFGKSPAFTSVNVKPNHFLPLTSPSLKITNRCLAKTSDCCLRNKNYRSSRLQTPGRRMVCLKE